MKVRIIINTMQLSDDMEIAHRRAEVWRGDIEIEPDKEYIAKVSFIGEGINEPIIEIPFSPLLGHYEWIPPDETQVENTEPL